MFTSEDTPRPAANGAAPFAGSARRRDAAPALDPVYIVKSVWRSKALILFCAVAGLALTAFIAVNTPKSYLATTQVLLDPRDLKVVANEVTPNGLPSEATLALVESQASVVTSSNVLLRIADEAGLRQDPEFNGSARKGLMALLPDELREFLAPEVESDPRRVEALTLQNMREHMTVQREAKSFVINLSMRSEDPEKAARLANGIASVFIDEQGRVQSDAARRATAALSSRLTELRRSVGEAEERVERYKSDNALVGVNGRLVDDQYIVQINDQLAKARGDITALRVRAESMRRTSVEDVVRGTLPEELASLALARARQAYSDLTQQSAALSTKLGPRHPQRIATDSALASAREAIRSELGRIVSSAQTELARAEATERDLTGQIDTLKTKQITTSGAFVRLRELEREVEASRSVYEAFLLRARETNEQESLNTANVRIISEAVPPLLPAGLSRKVIIGIGGLAGLMVGVGLAGSFAVFRLLRPLFSRNRGPRLETRPSSAVRTAAKAKLKAAMLAAQTGDAAPPPIPANAVVEPVTIPVAAEMVRPPVVEAETTAPRESVPGLSMMTGLRPAIHEEFDKLRVFAASTAPSALGAAGAALIADPTVPGAVEIERTMPTLVEAGTAPRAVDAENSVSGPVDAERATSGIVDVERTTPGIAEAEGTMPSVIERSPDAAGAPEAEPVEASRPVATTLAHPLQAEPLPAESARRSLADAFLPAARAAPAPVGDAAGPLTGASLRERIRALSQTAGPQPDARLGSEVVALNDEIRTVRHAIADIRRRRSLESQES